ncbi:hypothetical protein BGZ73_006549 [Actinomortierella ambigua]|nr:hypothetical protein BGZ73_006549 [Actinomortierella ambigua]
MARSSTRVPLSARPKDMAMFIYFVLHIPMTLLMDCVPIYPAALAPFLKPLIAFQDYYVNNYKDPFMGGIHQMTWFKTFVHMEGLVQVPIFIYAARCLYRNDRRAYLPICIYCAHVVTTVIPCLTSLHFESVDRLPFEVTEDQKLFLTSVYLPWLLFPLWMLYENFNRVRHYEGLAGAKKSK